MFPEVLHCGPTKSILHLYIQPAKSCPRCIEKVCTNKCSHPAMKE